jgi:hypothetical protein
MRQEIIQLFKEARNDLVNAQKFIRIAVYNASAFYCQQSVEKGLKALYMLKRRRSYPRTHVLPELAAPFVPPPKVADALKDLTMDYATARYPDAANGVPSEIYTRSMAQRKLKEAKMVWQWIDRQLKQ